MISKELLSEVLGVSKYLLLSFHFHGKHLHYLIQGNTISDTENTIQNNHKTINIYELAHKCKEWAMQTPYIVDQLTINIDRTCLPNKFKTRYWCVWLLRYSKVSEEFYADTEPEAVFKACQWLLENKDNK